MSSQVDFSDPIYKDSGAENLASSAASGQNLDDVSVNYVDLNDPNLLSDEMDTNAEVDAYAAPPPLPDGVYRVKIKQIDVKNAAGEQVKYNVKPGKDGKPPYAYTALEARVMDPAGQFDNYPIYDRFVSTMQQRNGGIPIVRILTVLGVKLPTKANAKLLLDLFFKETAKEPELEIETVWEGSLDQADRERFEKTDTKQPRVLGMHRFPQGSDGKHIPDLSIETAMGKINVHAQVRVNGYYPIGHKAAKAKK